MIQKHMFHPSYIPGKANILKLTERYATINDKRDNVLPVPEGISNRQCPYLKKKINIISAQFCYTSLE